MFGALKQLEAGRRAEDVAREVAGVQANDLRLEGEVRGMDVSEAQEAMQSREENTRLQKPAVDLSLDREVLQP